jgi:hypothetical protein
MMKRMATPGTIVLAAAKFLLQLVYQVLLGCPIHFRNESPWFCLKKVADMGMFNSVEAQEDSVPVVWGAEL